MLLVVLIILFFVVLCRFIGFLRFQQVRKLFRDGNCIVCGLRGSGKDLLFSNVVAYNNKPYCSNMNYCEGKKNQPTCFPFEPQRISIRLNRIINKISETITTYT